MMLAVVHVLLLVLLDLLDQLEHLLLGSQRSLDLGTNLLQQLLEGGHLRDGGLSVAKQTAVAGGIIHKGLLPCLVVDNVR